MDRVSAMLVNLLQVVESSEGAAAPFFVPIEDVIAELLAGLVPAPEQAPIAEALRSVAARNTDIAGGYTALSEAIQRAEQPAQRGQINTRLDRLNSLLDSALSLRQLLSSPLVAQAEVRLATVEVFRVIQQIAIAPGSDQPAILIFGTAPLGKDRTALALGKGTLLDRLEIAYERGSPYPRLNVMTASKSEVIDWAPARMNFQQKDSLDDELSILNARGRDLGRVYTERLRPPFTLAGGQITVAFPTAPGATFFATTIADANEKVVAQCVRVIPPSVAEA